MEIDNLFEYHHYIHLSSNLKQKIKIHLDGQFTSDLGTDIENHTNLFQSNITHITPSTKQQLGINIKETHQLLNTKIQSFNQHLDTVINSEVEKAAQEIHDITDNAAQTFADNVKSMNVTSNQENTNTATRHQCPTP